MSDAYEVIKIGTDTSGRPIYMNRRMKAAFDAACKMAGVTPTIVQGAYMRRVGGGASASAGTHDGGGCIDTRTWDLTSKQQAKLIKAGRKVGWAVWKRDRQHGGFDEHMHWVLLGDKDATYQAKWQMSEYLAGRDGLASRGRDYHWRPKKIREFNYQEWIERDWYDMATKKDLREVVEAAINNPEFVKKVAKAVWGHQITYWPKQEKDDPQKMSTGQSLNQARGYAEMAFKSASKCNCGGGNAKK